MHRPKATIVKQKSHTVAWFPTINKEWAQGETVNAAPLQKTMTGRAEQVDQHLQVNG